MASVILVDSDILIAHLRGVEAARDWLSTNADIAELRISVLSIAEVTGGMRSSERAQVWRLLVSLGHEPVTAAIARRAGELRRRWCRSHTGIGMIDYLIAATAIEHGFTMATLNGKHYPMIPDLTSPFPV